MEDESARAEQSTIELILKISSYYVFWYESDEALHNERNTNLQSEKAFLVSAPAFTKTRGLVRLLCVQNTLDVSPGKLHSRWHRAPQFILAMKVPDDEPEVLVEDANALLHRASRRTARKFARDIEQESVWKHNSTGWPTHRSGQMWN